MTNLVRKNKKLFDIASGQEGYFTAKQAVDAGFSYRLHHYYKKEGYWLKIDCGVFRLANYPNSPYEDLVRISLWSRNRQDIPQAVFSRPTTCLTSGKSNCSEYLWYSIAMLAIRYHIIRLFVKKFDEQGRSKFHGRRENFDKL